MGKELTTALKAAIKFQHPNAAPSIRMVGTETVSIRVGRAALGELTGVWNPRGALAQSTTRVVQPVQVEWHGVSSI